MDFGSFDDKIMIFDQELTSQTVLVALNIVQSSLVMQ